MRYRSIDIEYFGCFFERRFEFGAGLQLLHGPNESGKSTLHAFLVQLLFGFGHTKQYQWDEQGKIAARTEIVLDDGREAEFRRRKGRKGVVAGTLVQTGEALDEDKLLRLLGRQDPHLYETLFAITQRQLTEGSAALGAVETDLFGGGIAGGLNPHTAVTELLSRRDELFRAQPRALGRLQEISKELKEAQKAVRQAQHLPSDYFDRKKALELAQQAEREMQDEEHRLRERDARLQALSQVREPYLERARLREQRAALGAVDPDLLRFVEEQSELSRELRSLVPQIQSLENEVIEFDQQVANLPIEEGIVQASAEIEALLRKVEIYSRDEARRPELEAELGALEAELGPFLQARGAWDEDRLRGFTLEGALESEWKQLRESFRRRNDEQHKAELALAAARNEAAKAQATLDSYPEPPAPSLDSKSVDADVESLLADERERADALLRLERQRDDAHVRLGRMRAASPEETLALPLPRVEESQRFRQSFAALTEKEAAVEVQRQEHRAQRDERQKEIAALSGEAVPSAEALELHRAHREQGWRLIRRIHVEGRDEAEAARVWIDGQAPSLVEAYELAVRTADGHADSMFARAEQVSNRSRAATELDRLEQRLRTFDEELRKLAEQRTALQEQWSSVWSACPFAPADPETMIAWYADVEDVRRLDGRYQEVRRELGDRRRRQEDVAVELRRVLGVEADGRSLSALHAAARQQREVQKEAQTLRKKAEGERREAESDCARRERELQALQAELGEWQARWETFLRRLGLEGTWSVEAVEGELHALGYYRGVLLKRDALCAEQERIRSQLDEFARRVDELAERIDPELKQQPPAQRLALLSGQLKTATARVREREQLLDRKKDRCERLAQYRAAHQAKKASLAAVYEASGCADESAFLAAARSARDCARVEEELSSLERTLRLAWGARSEEQLEQAMSAHSETEVQAQLEQVQRDLEEFAARRKTAIEQRLNAARAFDEVSTDSAAAELQAQVEDRRAAFEDAADEWLVHAVAVELLQRGIRRYEREHQPRVLGEAQRLFAHMTGGRYTELRQLMDGSHSLELRGPGELVRRPSELSTGTREQLYLALRLAYVMTDCERNESLPLVLDDVLVNFDDQRARNTVVALNDVAARTQILFLTCHEHVAALVEAEAGVTRTALAESPSS